MTSLHDTTTRQSKLNEWLKTHFLVSLIDLKTLKNDASFRQYYRCTINGSSYVVMDAPPDKENIEPFLKITQILSQSNILVPDIIAYHQDEGFIVLSDFGDTWLLECLKASDLPQVASWYEKAMNVLLNFQSLPIQSLETQVGYTIPRFDAEYMALQLSYFQDWFLKSLLNLSLNTHQNAIVTQTGQFLIESAVKEPQILVHWDYHSRNLMVLPEGELGIIDYQDAKIGPLSYDLASLLKDCYIVWPAHEVEKWVLHFYEKSQSNAYISLPSFSEFMTSFELMALQRHLRVLGIFARLKIRDNKPHYVKDMPRIIEYILQVLPKYPELKAFEELWHTVISPAFCRYQALKEVPCVL